MVEDVYLLMVWRKQRMRGWGWRQDLFPEGTFPRTLVLHLGLTS
jgi:hypothetical protein